MDSNTRKDGQGEWGSCGHMRMRAFVRLRVRLRVRAFVRAGARVFVCLLDVVDEQGRLCVCVCV